MSVTYHESIHSSLDEFGFSGTILDSTEMYNILTSSGLSCGQDMLHPFNITPDLPATFSKVENQFSIVASSITVLISNSEVVLQKSKEQLMPSQVCSVL